jgi:hypothetical protein
MLHLCIQHERWTDGNVAPTYACALLPHVAPMANPDEIACRYAGLWQNSKVVEQLENAPHVSLASLTGYGSSSPASHRTTG